VSKQIIDSSQTFSNESRNLNENQAELQGEVEKNGSSDSFKDLIESISSQDGQDKSRGEIQDKTQNSK